ncbi:MAG: methyltransferase domain-containing protein [Cytophagaceae bacterium]
MDSFNKSYWTERYKTQDTGWDIGYVSTPLKNWIDSYSNKKAAILIPGAGNSYEAEYLFQSGFKNVTVVDISAEPLRHISERCPEFPKEQLIETDFFTHSGKYDVIIEQTFFCALDPSLRTQYVQKMHELLNPNGFIVGVMFNIPLNIDHPPFGGSEEEYKRLFEPYFEIGKMEACHNSIEPRAGREVFVQFFKK